MKEIAFWFLTVFTHPLIFTRSPPCPSSKTFAVGEKRGERKRKGRKEEGTKDEGKRERKRKKERLK